jgi:hypothetical protein
MAVEQRAGILNNYSTNTVTNNNVARNQTNGAKTQKIKEVVEIKSTDSDGSTYIVGLLQGNAVIHDIKIDNDAITGGTDYDLGIYELPETNDGAVIDKDCFMDGQSLASASVDINGFSAVSKVNSGKQVWELAGLTESNSKLYRLVLTANTVGSANGYVVVKTEYALA